ncbi:uncharacterized protein perm1b isoform X2 [Denticeps clupeoides]|uniref:uncharacterized protein perm1b isoform X2 n=1 Tax=Denticeps clupeoides TaxID=299321 RepID=UPI0010A5241B|nr:uncharacterized protein LOC114784779 isoform X2 [Denticeps clupeoides]
MDDLDHSVHIAEKDWDCFCEDSEECALLQPELAQLDESGLSDNESTKDVDQPNVEEARNEGGLTSISELLNVTSSEIDVEKKSSRVDQQTPDLSGQEKDSGEHHNESSATIPTKKDYDCYNLAANNNLKHKESQKKEILDGIEAAGHPTDVTVLPIKEKERWFVTVNDSPVRLRAKPLTSASKKRRKKKMSKGSRQWAAGLEQQMLISKAGSEAESCGEHKIREHPNPNSSLKELQRNLQTETPQVNQFVLPSQQHVQNRHDDDDDDDDGQSSPTAENPNTPEVYDTQKNTIQIQLQMDTSLSDSVKSQSTIASTHTDYTTHLHNTASNDLTTRSQLATTIPNKQNKNFPEEIPNSNIVLLTEKKLFVDFRPEDQSPLTPEEANEIETSLAQREGPTRPVYAISSFWDEMEKLTIDDILHLRNRPVLEEDIYPSLVLWSCDSSDPDPAVACCLQESILPDVLDNDSDYFTHVDDSKQRSSCEISTFSDFDEEFLQMINTSANPSPDPEEIPKVAYTEDSRIQTEISKQLRSDNMALFLSSDAESSSSTLSPCGSLQSLPTFEEIPFHNFGQEEEESNLLFKSYPLVMANSDLLGCVPSSVVSTDSTVPIFSCSRSMMADQIFPGVDVILQHEDQEKLAPVRVSSHHECYTQRRGWKSLLSFRQMGFVRKGNSWCEKARSWVLPVMTGSSDRSLKTQQFYTSSLQQIVHMGNSILTGFVSQARRLSGQEETSALRSNTLLFSLKQSDMCLVCIAMASWVLKSTKPQSADSWKAALLANLSAISSIQYLRHYMRKRGVEDEL